MATDISSYALDRSAIEEGIWKRYAGDIEVRIRSIRCRQAKEAAVAHGLSDSRRRKSLKASDLEDLDLERKLLPILAAEFRGMLKDGQPVGDSDEDRMAIVLAPEHADFKDWIVSVSVDDDAYGISTEDAEGN